MLKEIYYVLLYTYVIYINDRFMPVLSYPPGAAYGIFVFSLALLICLTLFKGGLRHPSIKLKSAFFYVDILLSIYKMKKAT